MHQGSALSFSDQNEEKGIVSGKVALEASDEAKKAVAEWVVYWSDSASERGKSVEACSGTGADGSICEISDAKIQGDYFVLFAGDGKGKEFFTELSVSVKDNIKEEPKEEETPEPTPIAEAAEEQPQEVPVAAPAVVQPVVPDEPIAVPKPVIIKVENILYDFDRAEIKTSYMTYLDETFEGVEEKEGMSFVIAGHADERGSNEYNLALGERRAYAVKRYLISLGFPEENIRIVSYGEEKPFDTGHSEEAWKLNRRAATEVAQ